MNHTEAVARSERALRAIHRISIEPETAFPEQVRAILRLGCTQFGMSTAAVTRIVGDDLEMMHTVDASGQLVEGAVMSICGSMCGEALHHGAPLGIEDTAKHPWSDHPARINLGIAAYLGTPVEVGGRQWGTLCFLDGTPRESPFTDGDIDLLRLMAEHLQIGLERYAVEQGLRSILEVTSGVTGAAFFSSTVEHVAGALDSRYVAIFERGVGSEGSRTLAAWVDGAETVPDEGETAAPAGFNFLGDEILHVTEGVRRRFPDDEDLIRLDAVGLIGVPIPGAAGETLGHLVAVHDGALEVDLHRRWLLQIFASRAGAEIDRLRAEQRAHENAQRYELATRAAHVGVWDFNVATGELYADSTIVDLLGLEDTPLPRTALEWFEYVHPDDRERVRLAVRDHIIGKTPHYAIEHRMIHRDGSLRWVSISGDAIRDERGWATRMVGTRICVTQRRRLEDVIRNTAEGVSATTGAEFFASLVEYLARSLEVRRAFIGEIVEGSPARVRLLCPWPGTTGGPPVYELRGTCCEKLFEQGRVRVERGAGELFGVPADGVHALLLPDGEGNPLGILGVLHDDLGPAGDFPETVLRIFAARAVAELQRRQAEHDQRQLERQIVHAEKLKSLGVLAGGIAHDFNNLLTGILGNASLALDEIDEDDPTARRLLRIKQSTLRAANLTKQMLAYSGRGAFLVQTLDINSVVTEMMELLETAVSRTAELRCEFTDPLPGTDADATQLRQIVMNLIMNASDALEGNPGCITLRTGVVELDAEQIGEFNHAEGLTPGEQLFLEVEDGGVGMSPETIRHMFDPFFTTKFSGRGLGMSAVHGIVRGHGGGIHVRSTPGTGTVVRVVFPISSRAIEEEAQPQPARPLPQTGRVLIVDDEEMVREVTRSALEAAGLTVLCAADGVAGYELFRRHRAEIDLVLLDLTMPRMNGRVAAEKIRAIAPAVPVLLMSGFDEQDAMKRFTGEGLAGFVQKPFLPGALLEQIRAVLDPT